MTSFVPQIQPQPAPEQWLFQGELRNGVPTIHIHIFGVFGQHESFIEAPLAVQLLEDGLNIARQVASKLWVPTNGSVPVMLPQLPPQGP